MPPDLAAQRQDYALAGLSETDLAPTWLAQLQRWLDDAQGLVEPNAMVLSTCADGRPSSRTVLLKGLDERGLVLFTNLTSRKAEQAIGSGWASALLPWIDLQRQVLVEGTVEQVARTESAAYFASRPRGSQLGAWASHQSAVVSGRAALEQLYDEVEARFDGDDVPLPDFWGGLRIVPVSVEFWQGRTSRLHDRLRYRLSDTGWVVERLSP